MMPRLFDERVGYFTRAAAGLRRREQRAQERRYIMRWRLEKKDPNAAVSEPVKPIVYYVDPATPNEAGAVREAGHRGVAAGVRGGRLQQRDRREGRADAGAGSGLAPEDARYSVVRWLPSTIENATGPHVHDPRTGEILEADIQMYHNIMNLQRVVVLHAGRAPRSARAEAAVAGRPDGRAGASSSSRTRSATRSASSTT